MANYVLEHWSRLGSNELTRTLNRWHDEFFLSKMYEYFSALVSMKQAGIEAKSTTDTGGTQQRVDAMLGTRTTGNEAAAERHKQQFKDIKKIDVEAENAAKEEKMYPLKDLPGFGASKIRKFKNLKGVHTITPDGHMTVNGITSINTLALVALTPGNASKISDNTNASNRMKTLKELKAKAVAFMEEKKKAANKGQRKKKKITVVEDESDDKDFWDAAAQSAEDAETAWAATEAAPAPKATPSDFCTFEHFGGRHITRHVVDSIFYTFTESKQPFYKQQVLGIKGSDKIILCFDQTFEVCKKVQITIPETKAHIRPFEGLVTCMNE